MSSFLKNGHLPTLFISFIYFFVGFTVWVLIGSLGPNISAEFQLTSGQTGLMVAVPILGGSILRVPLGMLSDRIGAKQTGMLTLLIMLIPLAGLWRFSPNLQWTLGWGLLLGIGGATFAVALPLARPWYPAEFQGLALGLVGAGNSGTVAASLLAPRLADHIGWRGVFGFAIIPVTVALAAYSFFARQHPDGLSARTGQTQRYSVLFERDSLSVYVLYAITFGGFVGLASFLNVFLTDQYHLNRVMAGNCTALAALGGSLLRPVGGYLADQFGGRAVLGAIFIGVSIVTAAISTTPPVWTDLTFIFLLMTCLGLGNGAIFQWVSLRFPKDMGMMTGFIGAFGGLGGFILPTLLGYIKQLAGAYSLGFQVFAAANLAALALLPKPVSTVVKADA